VELKINAGDEVIVYSGNDKYRRALVTEVWPSKYHPEQAGIVEIEYDNIITFGKTRKLIDADSIRSVKPRVKEG
jgi:hypothetical protein